ncbi:MAG: glycosyl transferase [Bacillaceae bacterium]|nr:MAG: glycosyl transferase [Bacillaceae bacterium]
MKKILMFTANYWNSPFKVGSHHIAENLTQKGWHVGYVSDPISPFHFLNWNFQLKDRLKIFSSGGRFEKKNLWTYVPFSFITPNNKPLLRHNYVYKNWVKYTVPSLYNTIKKNGFHDVDILYFDSAIFEPILDKIKYKKSVFRIADNYAGFDKYNNNLDEAIDRLSKKVDTVLYTAFSLKDYVSKFSPKDLFYFPNGVDFKHFNKNNLPKPHEFNKISNPIVLYIGAIDVWFDFDLLNFLVKSLPQLEFVLIGPKEIAEKRLEKRDNLHLLGRKAFEDLPKYIQHSDVGIIPFDIKNYGTLVNNINPLKLYEYMAGGLPVVSVEWSELKHLKSPAYLSRSYEEFKNNLITALQEKKEKSYYQNYARNFDWSTRVDSLINYLFK